MTLVNRIAYLAVINVEPVQKIKINAKLAKLIITKTMLLAVIVKINFLILTEMGKKDATLAAKIVYYVLGN